jgi:putative hemolysin
VPPYVWEIFFIFLLILANGFFAGAEIAIIAARKNRLEQLADEGDKKARRALELARDPDRFLPTVQVGITLVSTLAAAFGGARLVDYLVVWLESAPVGFVQTHRHSISFTIVVVCITYFSLILGELVPKQVALRSAETLARFVAPVMYLLAQVGRPAVWALEKSTSFVLAIFRVPRSTMTTVSMDDIEHMIESGTAEGVVEKMEQKVAMGALRLGERTVRDIMRPRTDLDAIDVTTPADEVIGSIAMAGFSRLPIYERDLDHILGYVHIKDLVRYLHLGWEIDLRKMLHPPLFVPETLHLDRLLEMFQAQRTQLAIVLDEHGGTDGMLTLEDVLEELVGEIRDEHREDRNQDFVRREDGSFLVDGGLSVADLIIKLDVKPDDVSISRRFTTAAGLMLFQLGRIPRIGDTAEWNDMRLEVVDMDGRRIDRILITPLPPPPEQSE